MQTGELTLQMALIVAVGVFLASFTDAIAGGGGIISVPTYLIAGLLAHYALGTNKLSAGLGTIVGLRQRELPEDTGEIAPKKQMAIVCAASLVVGAYDGFYGPGTGTFLLLIFCNLAKMDVRTAGGNVKLVNLASNMGALFTSLMSGKVFIALGLIGTVTSVLGHYIGSGLAIKSGSKIVKPTVVIVLILLAVKVIQRLITG